MRSILLASAASVMLGVGVALQHEAAAAESDLATMDPRLLGRLLRRRKWITGSVIGMVGAALQASAIASGSLVAVAPIFALHVGIALGFAAYRTRRPLATRHYAALVMAVVGMAGFLIAAAPQEADDPRATLPWAALIAAVGVAIVAARVLGTRLPPRHAAVVLAMVAGVGFGMGDGMIKVFTNVAESDGWAMVPSHWSFAVWGILGPLCFWLSQSAHQMADITASLPATSTMQPTIGALLGAVMFGESLRGGAAIPVEVICVGLLLAGVLTLASTPLPQPGDALEVADN